MSLWDGVLTKAGPYIKTILEGDIQQIGSPLNKSIESLHPSGWSATSRFLMGPKRNVEVTSKTQLSKQRCWRSYNSSQKTGLSQAIDGPYIPVNQNVKPPAGVIFKEWCRDP